MKNFDAVYRQLRRQNRKNYLLLAGCCFFSVLLITAYVLMMRSPTVLSVLPEGGDSRKQVMLIFVLAIVGCGIFTIYATGLFFRSKSRETGVFLALGAPRALLRKALVKELSLISVGACLLGAILSFPLAWGIWQLFRTFLVDTEEMALRFDGTAMAYAAAFSVFVIITLFFMALRFIKRVNILDIINEARKTEPIRDVKRWYGWGGISCLVLGGLLGYLTPTFCVQVLHWYPPAWTNITYAPFFVGLYMVLLHTVVNGWGNQKRRYRNIISTSMMKFQGRQTVRNMLIMTVLIAGACFAAFYSPMLSVGAMMHFDSRKIDYAFHARADQNMPSQDEIEVMAAAYGVGVADFQEATVAVLGTDGMAHVETAGKMGVTYTTEYRSVLQSDSYLSESDYNRLTGETIDLPPGTVGNIFDADGSGDYLMSNALSLVTNPITGQTLAVTPREEILRNDMLFRRRVLDDADFAAITADLSQKWLEREVFFNAADGKDSYDFAKALFYNIVDRSAPEVAVFDAFDLFEQQLADEAGIPYAYANDYLENSGFERISFSARDSSNFRLFWKYMPAFRVLDKADFVKTTAVYLMLFIFISIICFAAVIVIGYTRCLTVAMSSTQLYEDLRRLGASRAYLRRSLRGQLRKVWLTPTLIGIVVIYCFYFMIMFFNDNHLAQNELAGMSVCLGLVAAFALVLYGFYRLSQRKARALVKI